MKHFFFVLLALGLAAPAFSQMVATMEIKEPIEGLCDGKVAYVILPISKGQKEAQTPISEAAVQKKLNDEVAYLKTNPTFSGEGMVSIMISCKGQVVQCTTSKTTGNEELDAQIVAIFNSLGTWKAALIGKRAVDSMRLWSFSIKNGAISF